MMSKISFDISMSLDGYIAGPDQTPEEPLGRGGERLHEWAFGGDAANDSYIEQAGSALGAVITGRVNYEDSLRYWGADGPTGPRRLPVFVVGHNAPTAPPDDAVYTFVTDGLEAALGAAQEAAGEKDVTVMGGASIGRAYLAAGLVDEISIHLVPILLGDGLRMFDHPADLVSLEVLEVVATQTATHLRYRVPRASAPR
jgi:dihydrofolate reductase